MDALKTRLAEVLAAYGADPARWPAPPRNWSCRAVIRCLSIDRSKAVTSANFKGLQESVKLPGQDSNLDKENQNLLCYRYTTG